MTFDELWESLMDYPQKVYAYYTKKNMDESITEQEKMKAFAEENSWRKVEKFEIYSAEDHGFYLHVELG